MAPVRGALVSVAGVALACASAAFACSGESLTGFGAVGTGASGGSTASTTSTTTTSSSTSTTSTTATTTTTTTTSTGAGGAGTGGANAGGGGANAGGGGANTGGAGGSIVDGDLDGLDDGLEAALAASYFPYYSLDPGDGCTRHGVLFRLRPHPVDASKIAIWYDVLYEHDCGLNGHAGDDEVFGAVIDPSVPPPAGLLALRAISHQGTLCETKTTCGSLPNCSACTTATKAGALYPVVFASVDKHGSYVKESTCDFNVICDFGGCALNPAPDVPLLVNAGEPGAPLVQDLTAQGFVTPGNGWTEPSLMNYDPWGGTEFGSAGVVSDDLADGAFLIDPGGC